MTISALRNSLRFSWARRLRRRAYGLGSELLDEIDLPTIRLLVIDYDFRT